MAVGPTVVGAQEIPKTKDTDALFLDMSKIDLGTINSEDDKKKYIYTIQLEKARITRKTLRTVYENAFDLYRKGEYDGARDLTSKILAIDPGYEDASILQRATIELKGSAKPAFRKGNWSRINTRRGWSFIARGASSKRRRAGRNRSSSLREISRRSIGSRKFGAKWRGSFPPRTGGLPAAPPQGNSGPMVRGLDA